MPKRIVSDLKGVGVHSLRRLPVKGLVSASQPSAQGGEILIDITLSDAERRVTLLCELKHIIDGGRGSRPVKAAEHSGCNGLCTHFALSVLTPAPWLLEDWQAGRRDVRELAERYQVPVEAMHHRLYTLGLSKHAPSTNDSTYCQWQPHK